MTLRHFVQTIIKNMENFDATNRNSIKEVIRYAINDIGFKTKEGYGVLYIPSHVEEKLISKIAGVALGNDEETSIDAIYEGYVIVRKY